MKTRWMMMAGLIALCGMAQAAFVMIGNAGNAADTANGGVYGDVAYTYQISATEVTIAEFTASGAGNGNENFWLSYGAGTAAPASQVSLYETMKYCNYLTSGNINNGAYQFSGGNYTGTDRASAVTIYGTVYALPTEDEWYKAILKPMPPAIRSTPTERWYCAIRNRGKLRCKFNLYRMDCRVGITGTERYF